MCYLFSKWRIEKIHIYKKVIGIMTLCFIVSTLFTTGCSKSTNHREVRVSISKEDTQEKGNMEWKKRSKIDEDNNNIIYTDESGKKGKSYQRCISIKNLAIQKDIYI